MENTNDKNLFLFLDDKLLGKILQKIKEFMEKDFAKFSAITALCFSIAIWVIRSLGYFYTLGRFSVYHIDKSYIDVWTEGFLIQVIQTVSTCIFLLVINYMYFKLSIPQGDKNAKRRLKKAGFIFLEFIALSAWILFTKEISVLSLLKELPYNLLLKIVAFFIVWAIALAMVNAVGIEATIFYKMSIKEKKNVTKNIKEIKPKLEKKDKNKEQQEKKNDEEIVIDQSDIEYRGWVRAIEVLIIICILEFGLMYGVGVFTERYRSEFKVVVEEAETVVEDEYIFTNQETGESYYLYPIIYENEDVYILSQAAENEEGFSVNCDYQKVVDKKDVSTYYVDTLKIKK